jgi:hypothetical protein
LANTYLEIAKVLNKMKDDSKLEEAIIFQCKAVEAFNSLEKYADTDYLA